MDGNADGFSFQSKMVSIHHVTSLSRSTTCRLFIDDIVCFSAGGAEHVQDLDQFF